MQPTSQTCSFAHSACSADNYNRGVSSVGEWHRRFENTLQGSSILAMMPDTSVDSFLISTSYSDTPWNVLDTSVLSLRRM